MTQSAPEQSPAPIGFPMPLCMMAICCLFTDNYFLIFWAYQTFRNFQYPGPSFVGSAVYGWFINISLFQLIEKFEKFSAASGVPVKMHKYILAISFFLLETGTPTIMKHLDMGSCHPLRNGLALIPILFVQANINRVNRRLWPNLPILRKYNWIHWIIFAVMMMLYLAYLIAPNLIPLPG